MSSRTQDHSSQRSNANLAGTIIAIATIIFLALFIPVTVAGTAYYALVIEPQVATAQKRVDERQQQATPHNVVQFALEKGYDEIALIPNQRPQFSENNEIIAAPKIVEEVVVALERDQTVSTHRFAKVAATSLNDLADAQPGAAGSDARQGCEHQKISGRSVQICEVSNSIAGGMIIKL